MQGGCCVLQAGCGHQAAVCRSLGDNEATPKPIGATESEKQKQNDKKNKKRKKTKHNKNENQLKGYFMAGTTDSYPAPVALKLMNSHKLTPSPGSALTLTCCRKQQAGE